MAVQDAIGRLIWIVLYVLALTESVQGLICYYNYDVLGVLVTKQFTFCAAGGVIFVSILFAVYFHQRNRARARISQGRTNVIPLRQQQGAQIIISQQQQQGPRPLSYPPPQHPNAPRPPYNPQYASPAYCPPQMPPPPYSAVNQPGTGPPVNVAPQPMNPGYQKNIQQF